MYKKILLISALAASFSLPASANNEPLQGVSASSGTYASSASNSAGAAHGNSSPNFSFQRSTSVARNVTTISSFDNGSNHSANLRVGINSKGFSRSFSKGRVVGTGEGATTGYAAQRGTGSGFLSSDVGDENHNGPSGTGDALVSGSIFQSSDSGTSNRGTGMAKTQSFGRAGVNSTAKIHIDADHGGVSTTQFSKVKTKTAAGVLYANKTGNGQLESHGFAFAGGLARTYNIMSTMDDGTQTPD